MLPARQSYEERALRRHAAAQVLHQQAYAEAGGGLLVVRRRGAGNVEVGPGNALFDELLEEHAADDRVGVALTGGVLDIGVVALDQLLVIVPERQRPEPLVRAAAAFDQFVF